MSARQTAAGLEQPTEQRSGHAERRVGHDVVGPSWEAQIRSVGFDDHDASSEPCTQGRGSLRVCLDRNDACAPRHQGSGDGTRPRADVEHEGAAWERGGVDEILSPRRLESVPAPWPSTGHGGEP